MSHAPTIAALRSLVAAWDPADRRSGAGVPTGVESLDEIIGGGLPASQLTEVVCSPGAGAQLVLAQLLETTRFARQRIALIDAADSFAPEALEPDVLRHLVWARCGSTAEAFTVTDILVRDGNYSVVIVDLRDVPMPELLRTPKTLWHRLHLVAERQTTSVAVLTRRSAVPAVRWRLLLKRGSLQFGHRQMRREMIAQLEVTAERGHRAGEMTG